MSDFRIPKTIMGYPVVEATFARSLPDGILLGPLQTEQATADVSSEDILKSLLAVMDKAKAIPKPRYDAFISLGSLGAILPACATANAANGFPDNLSSIPVYEASDREDAERIYLELVARGKQPLILSSRLEPAPP